MERTEAKELTQEEASELLGISVRTFQRSAERYELEGDEGLCDRRMGRPSPRRAPREELERMLGLKACRLPRRHSKSTSQTGRNRCSAEGFSLVPAPDSCREPLYSMTSLAMARRFDGMVRTSPLAVFKLTIRVSLVGCSTGKSPGFAPFKILSRYDADRLKFSGILTP
jgi:helix-turn-helix protein